MNRILIIVAVLGVACAVFFFSTSGASPEFADGEKVFRFPLETDPPNIDPVMVTDATSDAIAQRLFNTLVRFDQKLNLQPELVEALPDWSASENSYTFKLRKNVKFHNGRLMTAADVKYSFERLLDPEVSKRPEILSAVKGSQEKMNRQAKETSGLQVLDDYTIKITLSAPNPTFLLNLAMICAAIYPQEAVDEALASRTTFSARPVGTGPFKLVKWDHDRKLVLKAHTEFFKGRPKIDGILYQIIPEPQTRLERFLKGEFEVTDIPFGQFKKVIAEYPALISRNKALRTNYLGVLMNRKDADGKIVPAEPLGSNAKLRQAINCAVNRENICSTILEGRSDPARSVLPPGMWGYDPELKGWTYDVAKAKTLLAEAGFPEGKGLQPIDLYYRKDADIERVVIAIQADLKAIGLPIELRSLEWGTFLKKVYSDNPPTLFYMGWVADYPDPDNFLYWLFHTSQWGEAGNETRYSNPAVDKLVESARNSMNPEERLAAYRQAEQTILNDCPWILLEYRLNVILVQPYVKNVREQLTPLDVAAGLSQVDFSKVELDTPAKVK